VRDRKVSDIHQILETWDVQGGGFSKIGINWRRIPQRKHIDSWFRTCQDEYRTSASHNSYEAITMTTRQQGGIAIFAGKDFRKYILRSVGDFRGPWQMEFLDHSSWPQPQNQDGGSLPGWSGTAKRPAHNLPTARALHTSLWPYLHSEGTVSRGHTIHHRTLDRTLRQDLDFHWHKWTHPHGTPGQGISTPGTARSHPSQLERVQTPGISSEMVLCPILWGINLSHIYAREVRWNFEFDSWYSSKICSCLSKKIGTVNTYFFLKCQL
jgi:hypothetical protein